VVGTRLTDETTDKSLTKYAFVWWHFEVHTAQPRTLEITDVLILIRVKIILVLLRGDRHKANSTRWLSI